MRNFREYDIWKSGIQITKAIYLLSEKFPNTEKYGLVSQIQRASVSIPSNIAEGAGRNSEKEFKQFLHIAQGSAFEVETQLTIALELNFLIESDLVEIIDKLHLLQRQINHLIGILK